MSKKSDELDIDNLPLEINHDDKQHEQEKEVPCEKNKSIELYKVNSEKHYCELIMLFTIC